jgi:hypothetical protein
MTPDMVKNEITGVMKLLTRFNSLFGLKYHVELSTMPEDHLGSIEVWEAAEKRPLPRLWTPWADICHKRRRRGLLRALSLTSIWRTVWAHLAVRNNNSLTSSMPSASSLNIRCRRAGSIDLSWYTESSWLHRALYRNYYGAFCRRLPTVAQPSVHMVFCAY